ncbi:ADP-ribosylation factor family-domain-containing protein [Lipomyces orientalis]|uniref:ADP-ribosylation factor family-domain-containing protein n=1 Tax=Lipomyces orientalis TaxID=1233043 RepID=A0ACC3TH44_9ASCO
MGLLTTLRKQKLKDKEMRLLMLGLDNSGKTTIVKQLLGEDVKSVSPTLGFNIKTVEWDGYKLNIWDVGGQSSLRPFWRNYYEKTDAILWVVDASSLDRLQDCKVELDKVIQEDRLTGAGLLILVNKIDIISSDEIRKAVLDLVSDTLQIDQITNHNCTIMACSAYTGENLKEGLSGTIEEIKQRLYRFD